MTNKQTFRIQRMATAAMLCALAYGCAAFSSLVMPIKIEGFLSLEIKDTVLMIGAFIFGPGTGLLMSVVVSLLELFTVSTTGWIGMVMNIVSSVMFICPAALVYKYRRTMSGAVKGLLLGAVLMTSGMYDESGDFAIRVGIPAKSGVGGGIMAVVPGRMGIGIYSPALDKKGNSVAGIKALERISKSLELSIF